MLPTAPDGYLLGVDIGFDQGEVDFPALIAAGVGFVIIRATDGIHDVDPRFEQNVGGALDANLPFGLYGVIEPYSLDKSMSQADNFIGRARDCGSTLPHWLDWELSKGSTAVNLIEAASSWCDAVEQVLGQRVMVYAGPAFVDGLARMAGSAGSSYLAKLAQRPLAVAHYGCEFGKPSVPPPWTDWTIWQAGPAGATLPGRTTAVDVDWFRGGIDDLAAFTTPPST